MKEARKTSNQKIKIKREAKQYPEQIQRKAREDHCIRSSLNGSMLVSGTVIPAYEYYMPASLEATHCPHATVPQTPHVNETKSVTLEIDLST